ncbi:putative membrane protein [Synechococcus sp. WH 8103]|nr:putative membrane protein [Synechococcus sp. WH 8103]
MAHHPDPIFFASRIICIQTAVIGNILFVFLFSDFFSARA